MENINKPRIEDNAAEHFNAREFLDDFRLTMIETGQVFNGPVKVAHKEELEVLLPEAETVVREQAQRTKTMLPTDTAPSFLELEESYIQGFTRVARGLGVSALRLADKGNQQFASVLRNPEKRRKVLKSLAADFRSLVWHLEGESTEDFNANVFKQYAVLYQRGDTYKALQRQFPDFSPDNLRGAVVGRPKNPKQFLDFAATKIQELSATPVYEEFPASTIKHAVFAFTSNPEGYLDHNLATIEELSANPLYDDFDMRAIRYVARHYTKTSPQVALDRAIAKAEQLRQDARYKDIPTVLLKNTALMSPDSVDATLENALTTLVMLKENPRLDIFGPGEFTAAVLFHPRNTIKYLENARQLFDDLRSMMDILKMRC